MSHILDKKIVSFDVEAKYIGQQNNLPKDLYGVKSSSLNDAYQLIEWIPNGFVISKRLVTEITLGILNDVELYSIKKLFFELIKDNNNSVIVRSSSTLEWINDSSFAGLYKSIRGVKTFENLLLAIKETYLSSKDKSLIEYATLKGIALPEEHLAILVQTEVAIKYSSLAIIKKDSDYIEFFNTDIIDSIQGHSNPIFTVERIGTKIKKNISSDKIVIIPKKTELGILKIINQAKSVLKFDEVIHLEIGSDGLNEYVFQVNHLPNNQLAVYLPNDKKLSKTYISDEKYPSKAEAMIMFKDLELFSNPLKIYDDLSLANLYDSICLDFDVSKGITVRFSYGNDISLPREFFKNEKDLLQWIKKTYIKRNISVIVHSYIEVRRSFELLLDKTECLLEHIPGMWESDNEFNPDVLYVNQTLSKVWKWKHKRYPLKGRFNVDMSKYENPIDETTIISWQSNLFSIIEKLRSQYLDLLPLNFHFVEDDNGGWNFLNIRKGFNLKISQLSHGKTHIIKKVEDVFTWNEKQPLQLQLKADRGSEDQIIKVIKLLPKVKNQTVIVDFGLLSHPAIILREFGYRLIPSYLYNSNRRTSDNYFIKSYDVGFDPIKRIMKEDAVFENDEIKVVYDRNEIVKGHLLLVTKKPYTSLIEIDNFPYKLFNIIRALREQKSIESFILLERGRAKFCTSGFTDSHAHAHILPREKLVGNYEQNFIKRTGAKKMKSIKEAIEKAKKTENEYIMIIKDNDEVFLKIVSNNISVEKQLIRTFFKQYHIE